MMHPGISPGDREEHHLTPDGHDQDAAPARPCVRGGWFQEATGHLYATEATPAGATYRFAREDRKRYPEILQAGTVQAPYQSTVRSFRSVSPTIHSKRCSARRAAMPLYRRHGIAPVYLPEQVSDEEACKRLVQRALGGFRLPYITITRPSPIAA